MELTRAQIWAVGHCRGRDELKKMWLEGLRGVVASKTGETVGGRVTDCGAEAASLLADYGWSSGTWGNRTSQLRKWLKFCDEEGRDPLPSQEGDVLTYTGYLSKEGRVGPVSAPQYATAVFRYHEDAGYTSPTNTSLVAQCLRAYRLRKDWRAEGDELPRIGLAAHDMRRIVDLGLDSQENDTVAACATVVFAYVFILRSLLVAHVEAGDVVFDGVGILRARISHRKAKEFARPFSLTYHASPKWEPHRGVAGLFNRWDAMRPRSAGYFGLSVRQRVRAASLGAALRMVAGKIGLQKPQGCFYASHIMRIGAFNELLGPNFSRSFIMHRLEWVNGSEGMLQVYRDSRIVQTQESDLFFLHLQLV